MRNDNDLLKHFQSSQYWFDVLFGEKKPQATPVAHGHKEVTILKPSDEQLRVTEMVRNVERKKEFYSRLNLHNAVIEITAPLKQNDNYYHNELRMNEVAK